MAHCSVFILELLHIPSERQLKADLQWHDLDVIFDPCGLFVFGFFLAIYDSVDNLVSQSVHTSFISSRVKGFRP